ncbi:YceI family protein [Gordonia sp. LUNF6]|uniref:YceI family protein n=1 Tax=Gordonia TaxID=2053 RepID=UPI0005EDB8D9|nr:MULTISPECIES: YceI family protein [Gordonia]KJR04239.1 lipid-binding protein [Gordonia sihwensis]KXT56804.1 lipid-binding protein [Gordonia sp. QH-12]
MTAQLTARVATPAGRGIDTAVVTVMSQEGQQAAIVRSDGDGHIRVDDLAAGMYTVVAAADGFQPAARTAVVSGPGAVGLGEVTLARVGGSPTPEAGRWEIDGSHSTIDISVRHLGIATVRGRFTEFTGTIVVGDDPEQSSVTAEISTASIDTDNRMRDEVLRSNAFFDAERYPTTLFHAERVRPASDETWTLEGTLTLRDTAVPVSLELIFLGQTEDPWGGVRAGFQATATLRRRDFGISFDDKLVSGAAQIGNTARVRLDIQAVRSPET